MQFWNQNVSQAVVHGVDINPLGSHRVPLKEGVLASHEEIST
jgi:hypothetical protein